MQMEVESSEFVSILNFPNMSIAKATVTLAIHSLTNGYIIKNVLKCFFKLKL